MRDVALGSLAEFPQKLERCFAAFPEELLNWQPVSWDGIPSERLTAIEQLCHIRDIERDGYHVRFKRVLEEDCPVLPDIPGEQLAIDRLQPRTSRPFFVTFVRLEKRRFP